MEGLPVDRKLGLEAEVAGALPEGHILIVEAARLRLDGILHAVPCHHAQKAVHAEAA
eukprot:CAMPEP_0168435232 /NCGR_PEP_ID=MMETSP0228-20121227/40310_1 /TAXON_ID=133427 /ORGANISM="Protoceratium reticulatum, Strain CCCM 535 (=CCMP 1889)" /LENGTH=56 /DNA_ID=CAMNT_0008449403 /DNA_START=300 /DNA_END=470 /DNA_ORIENTATION=+